MRAVFRECDCSVDLVLSRLGTAPSRTVSRRRHSFQQDTSGSGEMRCAFARYSGARRSSIVTTWAARGTARLEGFRRPATSDVRLVLYSKPDCPLCAGLSDKLEALRSKARFMPGFWSTVEVEMVDITSNQTLRIKYGQEVPVLLLKTEGGLVTLPRESPRVSADRLGQKLEEAINGALKGD